MLPSLAKEKVATLAESKFKTALRYLSAVNQSPAKVVLDPIYEAVADQLLAKTPLSPALRAKRYEENLYFEYRAQAEKVRYSIFDWKFDEARPDLLTARQRGMLDTFATGESAFSTAATFLERFKTSPELTSFFGLWFVEETNHHWGYHLYLERMKQTWSQEKREAVQGVDFRPYAEGMAEIAAANMYQELAAYLVYRSFARQASDPFLSRMVDQFAKDELRHYKFYQAVVGREIQRNPAFRKVVLKHFFKATSPMNQISGSPHQVQDHLCRVAFYFRKPEFDFMLKQCEFLFGTNLEELFGFFYRRHLPPCGGCGLETYLCACPGYEALAA